MRESAISEPLGPALQEVAPLDGGKPREVRRALDERDASLAEASAALASTRCPSRATTRGIGGLACEADQRHAELLATKLGPSATPLITLGL